VTARSHNPKVLGAKATANSTGKVTEKTLRKSRSRKLRITAYSCAILLILAIAARVFARALLCVDSGAPKTADAIIVLGGGVFDRPPRAAELFKAGIAGRIIVTGDGDCDENRLALVAHGVPATAIEVECRSTTTRENAEFTMPLLREAGVKRAIIVTSWYHSRRGLNTFRAVMPGIQFTAAPSYYSERPRMRITLIRIYKEYIKIAWYWMRWGVPPWQTS